MLSKCRRRGPGAGDDAAFTSPSLVVVEEFCDRGSLADLAAACEGVPGGPSLAEIPPRKGGGRDSALQDAWCQDSGIRGSALTARPQGGEQSGDVSEFYLRFFPRIFFARSSFLLAAQQTGPLLDSPSWPLHITYFRLPATVTSSIVLSQTATGIIRLLRGTLSIGL